MKKETLAKHFRTLFSLAIYPRLDVYYLSNISKVGRVFLIEVDEAKYKYELYISPTGRSIRVVKIK